MRAFGLRDRKALRPSITLTASPSGSLNLSQQSQSPLPFASQRSSGLGAFAAPPRRVSKRISASDFMFQSPSTSQEIGLSQNTPEDQLASELGSVTGLDMHEDVSPPSGFDEPDLPPTPTQLGLEPPPGRPKGLLSSSPSMQHGKWGKRRATGDLETSPSKLRTVDYGSELENFAVTTTDVLFPQSVVKKRKLKREVSIELESLKQDIAKIEGLCDKLKQNGEEIEPYLDNISSLLISTDPSQANPDTHHTTISSFISTLLPFSTKRPSKPRQTSPDLNPFDLGQSAHSDPYLTALAPLRITASVNSITKSDSGTFLERHQITLSASSPFPSNFYKARVSYETNPETQSVISLAASVEGTGLAYLQQWINKRLESPLGRLDVSGLCWGINRYWEALLSRAQFWAQMEAQHSTLIPGRSKSSDSVDNEFINREILTTSDIRRILPHLERTSMPFESKQNALGALLSCEITINDWTGEPELTPTICASTFGFDSSSNEKVEQESKKLFQAVLTENTKQQSRTAGGSDPQAIVTATHCVLDALFGAQNGKHKL
ncbi:uncharacterized protein DSM5745_08985 [Aspergillus mulundensis]|uniref:Uncharacterized protein n=1 Tax=Aspergillus mulundensis TaxID=1810919 RepID=A0A3D8QZB1_9EURO|nr:Uncharacterized protein DSM5745_08985 [Aspergillus mulundensis]RDW67119.1 Uncharacterized protein DSM5745_08985 [Aspergillus mulundensis]